MLIHLLSSNPGFKMFDNPSDIINAYWRHLLATTGISAVFHNTDVPFCCVIQRLDEYAFITYNILHGFG